jgi:oligopeptide/dipeptide ABC transporter ATP-binding protein
MVELATAKKPLLKVRNLSKNFSVEKNFFGKTTKTLRAVHNVNFDIFTGECLSLVGESGCGKSTTARLILNLIKADHGEVEFDGVELLSMNSEMLRHKRQDLQMVFQNPFSSLDPRFTIFDSIAEPLIVHKKGDKNSIKKRVFELLDLVDLPKELATKYPHECSGGQNQRVSIARAIALNPKLVVCDEAVSALDVSVQANVLTLIKKLQKELQISFLFIAHDLGVVKMISDRVAVMYLGEIVELSTTQNIFENPKHPYTKALIASAPVADPTKRDRKKIFLEGEIPKPTEIPSGCPFHTRCPEKFEDCVSEKPVLRELNFSSKHKDVQHQVSCLLFD